MKVCLQFTGDILCQMPQTEACRTENGFDYAPVFAPVQKRLAECDYLIGNLETPVAGEKLGYSDRLYQFNTPDAFLDMIRDSGFDLLSTANNHCMDRHVEGLVETLNRLDARGILHTGTFRSQEERDTPCIVTVGGIRFGFISYTYGTNAFFHHMYLPDDQPWAVNLLQPEEEKEGAIDLLDEPNIARRVQELYETENPVFRKEIEPRLLQLKQDIRAAREAGAEYVVMLLHCGGQHNLMPDAYTRWIVDYIAQTDVDLIIGHHQHILHPCKRVGKPFVAYCLGNLTDTPDHNPNGQGIGEEYSILLRVNVEKDENGVSEKGITFVPVKSVLDEQGRAVVREVTELIRECRNEEEKERLIEDLTHFVRLVSNMDDTAPVPVQDEYTLE